MQLFVDPDFIGNYLAMPESECQDMLQTLSKTCIDSACIQDFAEPGDLRRSVNKGASRRRVEQQYDCLASIDSLQEASFDCPWLFSQDLMFGLAIQRMQQLLSVRVKYCESTTAQRTDDLASGFRNHRSLQKARRFSHPSKRCLAS